MTIFYSHYGALSKTINYVVPSYLGLRVYFTETVYDDSNLQDPTNYSITPSGSGVSVTVLSVTPQSGGTPLYVDLTVTDITHGESYLFELTSGVIQDSGQTKYFTLGLSANFSGVSVIPNITEITSTGFNQITITFSKAMNPDATFLDTSSYVVDGGLEIQSVSVVSSTIIALTTSFQAPITYNLTASSSITDVWLNALGTNTGSFTGTYTSTVTPSTETPQPPSEVLSDYDRHVLSGFQDIQKIEPEQILPEPVKVVGETSTSPIKRLKNTQNLAKKILDLIAEYEQIIDEKCSKFKVTSEQSIGSPLFKAMVRVFNERTTTVTYDHYRRALEIRAQLMKEDSEKVKSK